MKRIRRGMTLLELLLAVSVTSTVALGIVGMMDALTNGIIDQRDTRASILRAGLSQTRVSSYIARARCLLDLEDHRVVMWLEDTDGDEAVDGTEVRWLEWSPTHDVLSIHWFADPAELLDTPLSELEDIDWWTLKSTYETTSGLKHGALDLAASIANWSFDVGPYTDPRQRRLAAQQQRTVLATYDLNVEGSIRTHCMGESMRRHQQPSGGGG
ncbi:MAG: prepilin-type N-terminal cleavage/methylation domain-containing protein [Phycisphaerales bacterium]|nr:prepilin-type N-terminal cleavage/methylation domain-containing protein [Phycisphaerales bacterium]